jgi:hypothetical protein
LDDLRRNFAEIAKDNRRAAEHLVARIFDVAERLTLEDSPGWGVRG